LKFSTHFTKAFEILLNDFSLNVRGLKSYSLNQKRRAKITPTPTSSQSPNWVKLKLKITSKSKNKKKPTYTSSENVYYLQEAPKLCDRANGWKGGHRAGRRWECPGRASEGKKLWQGVHSVGPVSPVEERRGAVCGLDEGDDWGQHQAGYRLPQLHQGVVWPVLVISCFFTNCLFSAILFV